MTRIDSADSILDNDVEILGFCSKIIDSMETEADVSMKLKVQDPLFEKSIQSRVLLLGDTMKGLEGDTAKGVMSEVFAIWSDKGAAIDDFTNPDGSSQRVVDLSLKIGGGHLDEDYTEHGWENE